MARNEIVIDLTDSREFEPNVDRSGNVYGVEVKTEYSKAELVLDEWAFEKLLDAMLQVAPRKRQGVA